MHKKSISPVKWIIVLAIALLSFYNLIRLWLIKPIVLNAILDTREFSVSRAPFLNDQTLDWSTDVDRVWLDENPSPRPPAKLLFTNFGWNSPDQVAGLKLSRSKRLRGLIQGVINHPWFDPTAWEDMLNNQTIPDPSIRYYVFLDVETCFESNWPDYGRGYEANCDVMFNRSDSSKGTMPCYHSLDRCRYIKQAVETRLFRSGVNATLVVFECRGDGQHLLYRNDTDKKKIPMALATLSSSPPQMRDPPDQGLPPPSGKTATLSPPQVKDIETCNEDSRPLLLSFVGNFRHKTRQEFLKLHNGKDVLAFPRGTAEKSNIPLYFNGTYEEVLASSKFSAAPRGDNKFSYRFTEVLAAGAIPVVHADGWVLPFRKELVDWSECAVVMPEVAANQTLEYIANITSEERCKMRKRCYEIYQKYISSDEAVVAGIIEGLERVVESRKGYWYSPDYYVAPS